MKLVNTKADLRNQYPENNPISKKYVGNTLVGEYSQNKIQLNPDSFSDVLEIPNTNFKTLILLDGQLYGSSGYLSELRNSKNPYINKSNVAIVELSSSQLSNVTDFKVRENYSEVTINSTLSTKEDFIKHIGWLLDQSQQELREPGVDYGSYSLNTTSFDIPTDSGLGFEFSDDAQQSSTSQTSTTTQSTSTTPTQTSTNPQTTSTTPIQTQTTTPTPISLSDRPNPNTFRERLGGGRRETQIPDIISIGPGSAGPIIGRVPTMSGNTPSPPNLLDILRGGRPENNIRISGEPPGGLKKERRKLSIIKRRRG